MNDIPYSMKAEDVARFLNISTRYAYEIMESEDFPLLRLGRSKRVLKEDFLKWLKTKKEIK